MVMDFTAADAIMIGRIAQQRPWIFQQIDHYLSTGLTKEEPQDEQKQNWLLSHLKNIVAFYGEFQGIKIARKHINWQLGSSNGYHAIKPALMQAASADLQLKIIADYFGQTLPGALAVAS